MIASKHVFHIIKNIFAVDDVICGLKLTTPFSCEIIATYVVIIINNNNK